MRIISGKARATKLYSLEGTATRPTLDRVKEAIFNIIYDKIRDSLVLDLFSGSGAIGLEAASRGAKQVILCDKSKEAINIIKRNIEKTKLENVFVINDDYKQAIQKLTNYKFDIIYLDPPFETDYAQKAVNEIIELDILDKDGIIIIETENKQKIINDISDKANIYDTRKYGRIELLFIR